MQHRYYYEAKVKIKFCIEERIYIYHHILQRSQRIHPRIHQTAFPATPSQGLGQMDGSCFLQSEGIKGNYM